MLKVGDRVIMKSVGDRAQTVFVLLFGVMPGEIGEVQGTCQCAGQHPSLTPVLFEGQKMSFCPRTIWLEKLPPVEDKMVDWSQVPKPWEIGVKG